MYMFTTGNVKHCHYRVGVVKEPRGILATDLEMR